MDVYGKAIAIIDGTQDEEKFGPNGGFTAVLSSPSLDRDGDRLAREEWIEPLPDRLPLDIDHGMTVADTVGSFHPYWEGDLLMMDAHFASTPKAQETRTLIREGHIGTVSVAFMTDKSKKDGQPRRELLNAGIVAIPSNRDAVILASKAATALKDVFESGALTSDEAKALVDSVAVKALVDDITPQQMLAGIDAVLDEAINLTRDVDRSTLPVEVGQALDMLLGVGETIDDLMEALGVYDPDDMMKSVKAAGNGDRALTQAIHDAAIHLGALCFSADAGHEDPTGAQEGANVRSVSDDAITFSAGDQSVVFRDHDEARKFFSDMLKSLDDADAEGVTLVEAGQLDGAVAPAPGDLVGTLTLEQFKTALTDVLSPQESAPADSADSPAEAAAASVEEPAPAVDAADDVVDAAVDPDKRANHMLMSLYATQF